MRTTNASNEPSLRGGVMGRLLIVALPLLVLAGGVALAMALLKSPPKAQRTAPARIARLVETRTVEFSTQPTVVQAHGTVQPAREVVVYPRVAGEVIEISPELVPGGRFQEGDVLLKIDPRDFELAVRQRETDLASAKASLALEMGQQTVARREYELLGETVSETNRALVLRQPQLAQAKSAVEAAEAALDLAKLNLDRTTVRAPFNATIRERNINVGTQVTTATPLATATGSDEYWVELTVPVDQLRWIQIPDGGGDQGSAVRIFSETQQGQKEFRRGEVFRLLPDLEPHGRLARVLVTVRDPLALGTDNAGKPILILGDYVRGEIQGVGLPSAVALNRDLFRDGNQVWVMNKERELEIRPVTVAFRGPDTLLVTDGLEPGDRIITTDLPAAVEGMALRATEDGPANTEGPAQAMDDQESEPAPAAARQDNRS